MKLLVAFLFSALGCGLAGGQLLSKCDLRKAFQDLPEDLKQQGLTMDLVAKIVCHAELASGFNTSAVTELTPRGGYHSRKKRQAVFGDRTTPPGQGHPPPATKPPPATEHPPHTRLPEVVSNDITTQPSRVRRFAPTKPPHKESNKIEDETEDEQVWTLYGVFQLSNHLVCSDGTTPSPNICEMNCNNFADGDIRDDIRCVLKVISQLIEKGFGADNCDELIRAVRLIFQPQCSNTKASVYFAECM